MLDLREIEREYICPEDCRPDCPECREALFPLLTELRAARKTAAEAGCILEALNLAVMWELAPDVKAEIVRVLPLVRATLARCTDGGDTP